ncbi:hypothetical protein J6I75_06770 [Pseudidiomarina sp. 1APP75-27a]|uniref:hypothetical protein n=1 Tax=Pseudidiomarina terrestris TaxID=2820060 RepID=UPI002B060A5E|nr:hypothetical protein [Pseudidiomarina sp. 1APP75-27a]MEA3588050.1 hypothetical protein [Pseudidiomarina sp. 1APP75-27a]
MNQSKKGYRMRSWLFGFVASILGLLIGVWMGVRFVPNYLLASEFGFTLFLWTVEDSVEKGDIPEAKKRMQDFYFNNRDRQIGDLYQNELFLGELQLKDWEFVLAERVKESEE